MYTFALHSLLFSSLHTHVLHYGRRPLIARADECRVWRRGKRQRQLFVCHLPKELPLQRNELERGWLKTGSRAAFSVQRQKTRVGVFSLPLLSSSHPHHLSACMDTSNSLFFAPLPLKLQYAIKLGQPKTQRTRIPKVTQKFPFSNELQTKEQETSCTCFEPNIFHSL